MLSWHIQHPRKFSVSKVLNILVPSLSRSNDLCLTSSSLFISSVVNHDSSLCPSSHSFQSQLVCFSLSRSSSSLTQAIVCSVAHPNPKGRSKGGLSPVQNFVKSLA